MAVICFSVSRNWKWIRILVIVGFIIFMTSLLAYLIPIDSLRRYAERQINGKLTDYTVSVGRAYFHPIDLSLVLDDLVLVQNANPDPPVASIKRLHARVHWIALIKGKLVGDFLIDQPKLYINLKQVRQEEESHMTFKQKGWQEAIEAVYPLKIDVIRIRNGELTYIDQGPYKPLHISGISLHAGNIRNIFSPEFIYPSPVKFEATLFDKGKLNLDGHANFLQNPHVSFKGEVDLREMDLEYFTPITERQNISVRKGTLSAKGNIVFAPGNTEIDLMAIEFIGLDADYSHRFETAAKKNNRVQIAKQAAKKAAAEVSNAATLKIRIDELKISQGTLGYLNRTIYPNVRIYADHIEASLKDFNNQIAMSSSQFQISGRFMGSGPTRVTGAIRPNSSNPNISFNIAIVNTEMKAMRRIFQAYGKFDIKNGKFSFFSEITIRNNRIKGYVKPLFKNMEVAAIRIDEEKSFFHKVYARFVSSITELLKNRSRKEVATRTDISGTVEDPRANIAQIIVNLIRNAFFKAILPGFEREVSD